MSNSSVSVRPVLSGKQSLSSRVSQMLAAFERSQTAKADRVIRRFSCLGACIPEDEAKQRIEVSKPFAAASYQRSLVAGVAQ